MVAIEGDVVQHGRIGPIAPEALVPFRKNPYRPCPHDRYASTRTNIGLSSDLDRTVLDHDSRARERSRGYQVDLKCKTQDGSALGVDANLNVVTRIALE